MASVSFIIFYYFIFVGVGIIILIDWRVSQRKREAHYNQWARWVVAQGYAPPAEYKRPQPPTSAMVLIIAPSLLMAMALLPGLVHAIVYAAVQ